MARTYWENKMSGRASTIMGGGVKAATTLDMNGKPVVNVADPQNPYDAVNKQTFDYLANVAMRWRGEWEEGVSYDRGDVVLYEANHHNALRGLWWSEQDGNMFTPGAIGAKWTFIIGQPYMRFRGDYDFDVVNYSVGDVVLYNDIGYMALVNQQKPDPMGVPGTSDEWLPLGGVSDHGELDGLGDDDHTQYALADGTRGNFAATSHTHSQSDVTGLDAALEALPKGYVTEHVYTGADQTGITTAVNTNSVVTFDAVAGRRYRVSASLTMRQVSAAGTIHLSFTSTGSPSTGTGRFASFRSSGSTSNADRNQMVGWAIFEWPSSGSVTIRVVAETSGGTAQVLSSAGSPSRLLVEDIGPA